MSKRRVPAEALSPYSRHRYAMRAWLTPGSSKRLESPFFLRKAKKEGGLSKDAAAEYDKNVTLYSDASLSGV